MPTFDGINLTITLDSGVTEVDVQDDLYSPWKDWVRTEHTNGLSNRMFPAAFNTSGGDPLTPGIKAGAYFFLRNDFGWRLRPPEEDINITLTGNLAGLDTTLPVLIPTIGDFTVLVAGLQPITQSVAELLAVQTIVAQLLAGNVDISNDDLTITVFAEGSTTDIIATLSMSADGRIRRRLT